MILQEKTLGEGGRKHVTDSFRLWPTLLATQHEETRALR
jgi:hypothetical protein